VLAMTASTATDMIVVGGEFTTLDGTTQKRFALFD